MKFCPRSEDNSRYSAVYLSPQSNELLNDIKLHRDSSTTAIECAVLGLYSPPQELCELALLPYPSCDQCHLRSKRIVLSANEKPISAHCSSLIQTIMIISHPSLFLYGHIPVISPDKNSSDPKIEFWPVQSSPYP